VGNKGVLTPDICVIGAGSAGLSVAAGAVQMGASVVLVEKGKMGGDCLNTGCVPSKSLLAAAHRALLERQFPDLGVKLSSSVEFARVSEHVKKVIASIEPHDSVERFEGLGVNVVKASAQFISPREIEAGEHKVRARRFVLATGSQPFVPPIDGLKHVPFFTNETIFDLTELPARLIVLGGGPIGCELAQAFRGLGSEVAVVEMNRLLPKDDPELRDVLRQKLIENGVQIFEGVRTQAIVAQASGIEVTVSSNGQAQSIEGSHMLVATGRRPIVHGLGLDYAGIEYSEEGVRVDSGLKTTNRRVYAIGDCVGGLQFTHVAGYHAGVVVRNALFRLPSKASYRTVPWVTYTDPEVAQVGLTEEKAREVYGDNVRVLVSKFEENDRARAEGRNKGLVKVVTSMRGKIYGCGIVGPSAGELIQPWVLAMSNGLKIGSMATMIAPYPTLGEISKRAAGSFYTPTLYGPSTRALVKFLSRFG